VPNQYSFFFHLFFLFHPNILLHTSFSSRDTTAWSYCRGAGLNLVSCATASQLANSFWNTRCRSFRHECTYTLRTPHARSTVLHLLPPLGIYRICRRRDKLATTTTLAAVDSFPGFGLGPMNPSHQRRYLLSHESQPRGFAQQDIYSSYRQHEEPSPPYSNPSEQYSPRDQFEIPPAKRQKVASPVLSEPGNAAVERRAPVMSSEPALRHDRPGSARGPAGSSSSSSGAGTSESRTVVTPAPGVTAKSRRVRTGCLTCRERHLKCDEGTPDCNNCRKSSRECKRGLRLNFIDIQVKNPPMVPPTLDWSGTMLPLAWMLCQLPSRCQVGTGTFRKVLIRCSSSIS
jgi:hypothetical protein